MNAMPDAAHAEDAVAGLDMVLAGGARFEVLASTDRRIDRLRVSSLLVPAAMSGSSPAA